MLGLMILKNQSSHLAIWITLKTARTVEAKEPKHIHPAVIYFIVLGLFLIYGLYTQ